MNTQKNGNKEKLLFKKSFSLITWKLVIRKRLVNNLKKLSSLYWYNRLPPYFNRCIRYVTIIRANSKIGLQRDYYWGPILCNLLDFRREIDLPGVSRRMSSLSLSSSERASLHSFLSGYSAFIIISPHTYSNIYETIVYFIIITHFIVNFIMSVL